VRLVLTGALGTCVYFGLVWLFSKSTVLEAIDIFRRTKFEAREVTLRSSNDA